MSHPDRTYALWLRRMRRAEALRRAADDARAKHAHAEARAADAFVGWLLSGTLRRIRWRPVKGVLAAGGPLAERVAAGLRRFGGSLVRLLEDRAAWRVDADLRLAPDGSGFAVELHAAAYDARVPGFTEGPCPPDIRKVARRLGLDVEEEP